jgi:SPP1 gp7 family putative phage head morphogenesis protein
MSIHIPTRLPVRSAPAASVVLAHTPGYQKAMVGVGAGPLQTEFNLTLFLGNDAQATMAKMIRIGTGVDWIRAAERVISGKFSTCAWHIEDPDGEVIDDDYEGDARAIDAFRLLERPMGALDLHDVGRRLTRRQQWEVTSRHMGLAGNGCWYLDARDGLGIPSAILYIRPDRLTPVMSGDVLSEWSLDAKPGKPGIPLPLEDIVHMTLETPDNGVWAPGLVETALTKALLNGKIDRHFGSVLDSGGRISGILSPRQGVIEDDNVYQQMVRDWRNVTEQPESAKRVQIVRAPVDFTPTVQTPGEMQVIDLMYHNRDALLALWGVPLSQVGGSTAAGLNGGDVRKYDEAALWQNAVYPRLVELAEPVQGIMDLFVPLLGWAPTFILDAPTFDDDGPSYEMALKARDLPLRNSERRAIVNLEPFGEDVMGSLGGPLDDEIWVPVNITPLASSTPGAMMMAPPAPAGPTPDEPTPPEDEGDAGATGGADDADSDIGAMGMKARGLRATTTALRASVERRITPVLRRSVADVLADQRAEVVRRATAQYEHLTKKPDDDGSWWNASKWDKALARALTPGLLGVADTVRGHVLEARDHKAATYADLTSKYAHTAGAPASTRAIEHLLRVGAGRVTRINETTRAGLRALIAEAVKNGLGPGKLGDVIERWAGWNEYRAERIATTELQFAYNAAALDAYRESGIEQVEAIDGDEDDECAARNGEVMSVEEAEAIDDHPNGTLDWMPVIDEPPPQKADPLVAAVLDLATAMANQPAPIINIAPAPVSVTTPDVHVTIEADAPRNVRKVVHRDKAGQITHMTETPEA